MARFSVKVFKTCKLDRSIWKIETMLRMAVLSENVLCCHVPSVVGHEDDKCIIRNVVSLQLFKYSPDNLVRFHDHLAETSSFCSVSEANGRVERLVPRSHSVVDKELFLVALVDELLQLWNDHFVEEPSVVRFHRKLGAWEIAVEKRQLVEIPFELFSLSDVAHVSQDREFVASSCPTVEIGLFDEFFGIWLLEDPRVDRLDSLPVFVEAARLAADGALRERLIVAKVERADDLFINARQVVCRAQVRVIRPVPFHPLFKLHVEAFCIFIVLNSSVVVNETVREWLELAEHAGLVSGLFEHFGELRLPGTDRTGRRVLHRVPTSHEHVSAWRASARARVRIQKLNSLFPDSIDIRRRHFSFSVVNLKVTNAEVVAIQQDHVRSSVVSLCDSK